ncbi:MAG: tRNA (adenosine(37)-N6)-threonylcarbamoyltransferase complex ATPase subunit type 1 TsaE [Chloroflexi bacterium]|nr:tRNA (adenosine(37)-N6)-threonylcarbamoyltransferase complex ATPase subunit type 1 TsaE [Chloroflexota bacterium]
MHECTFLSDSPGRTLGFGRRMGKRLTAGSVIALVGELGSGKTLLTRGICGGLGVPPGQVNSPTFILVNEYRGRLPVLHMDLYRLDSLAEGFEIGMLDYLERARSGVMIIEWAEKVEPALPPERLQIRFEVVSDKKRRLLLSNGARYDSLLNELCRA